MRGQRAGRAATTAPVARASRSRTAPALLALAAALLAAPGGAHAQTSPSDSLLDSYVRSMRDSTDAWFGSSAAAVDTTGLDSALAAGLARPRRGRWRSGPSGPRFGWSPALGFNRADGGQLGADASIGLGPPGRVLGRLQYTTGTHDLLGEGGWAVTRFAPAIVSRVGLRVVAGRYTEPFDRDQYDPVFSTLSALVSGADRHQYLRRDGAMATLRLSGRDGFATVGWRDQLESSLPYTTSWYVFGRGPTLAFNDAAALGRARELVLAGDVTIPGTRFRLNAAHWTSDPRLGSDFRYRRTRVSLGGDLSLGRHVALVPQVTYGRLRGQVLPQEAFFLGGVGNLRALERNELAGSGRAFARADLVFVDELGRLLHVPLPAWMPVQAGAFIASGAVWGSTGAVAVPAARDAPLRQDWLSEAGVGLSWRYGIPDPLSALRFEYAVPIGAGNRDAKLTVAYQRPLNLLPAR